MTILPLMEWAILAVVIIADIYMIGAFLSWWTFFGIPVSMRP